MIIYCYYDVYFNIEHEWWVLECSLYIKQFKLCNVVKPAILGRIWKHSLAFSKSEIGMEEAIC